MTSPYHSIIGDRGKGDLPNSPDGLVPYWNADLNCAKSELIVPGPIAELHRVCSLNPARPREQSSAQLSYRASYSKMP
jgi:hypothetical protein